MEFLPFITEILKLIVLLLGKQETLSLIDVVEANIEADKLELKKFGRVS